MTGRDLKFQQRHSLQRRRISLAFVGSAKDGFGYGLHMCGTHRLGQRRNRCVQGIFHDAYGFRRKRYVREVFHFRLVSIEFLKATLPPDQVAEGELVHSRWEITGSRRAGLEGWRQMPGIGRKRLLTVRRSLPETGLRITLREAVSAP